MSTEKTQVYQKEVVTGPQLSLYASIKCEKPRFVMTRTGKRIAVPCGSCISCLRKRRNSWSVRLDDESKHLRCVDQFGITLTYNSASIPWLPLCVLQNGSYTYKKVSKDKLILSVYRGCTPEQLRNKTAVSLAFSYDIENYIKRLRKWFEDNYPDLFIRYYIVSDYGELEGKRTGRAHYHGIIFIFAKDVSFAQLFRNSPNRFAICQKFRDVAMDKWHYAERIYNRKKNIYIGKDYHQIDKGYTSYLGKYLNKYEDTEAIGRRYVDTRIFCSRMSKKYGLGSIGFSSYKENNQQDYKRFLVDLDKCVKRNILFRPSLLNKSLNGSYRKQLFEDYFGFKFSRLAQYIQQKRYKEQCYTNIIIERKEELDPNDPFEVLYIDFATIKQLTIYKRIKLFRRRNSILRPRQYTDYVFEEYDMPKPFTMIELCGFCRYLDFSNNQLDLYINQFKGIGKYIIQNHLILPYLSGYHYKHKETFVKAIYARKEVKNYCKTLHKFADEYQRYHELTNSYTDY